MKLLYSIAILLGTYAAHSQPQKAQITQGVVEVFTTSMPQMPPERFVDITKAWANTYTRSEGGYDASNVTANTITISAFKRNAFRYQNTGETVENKIRYNLVISFTSNSYKITFEVPDIYGNNDVLLKYKLPDYYKDDGTLKDGYEGLETSLRATVDDIIQSHYSYLANYK